MMTDGRQEVAVVVFVDHDMFARPPAHRRGRLVVEVTHRRGEISEAGPMQARAVGIDPVGMSLVEAADREAEPIGEGRVEEGTTPLGMSVGLRKLEFIS